jgi:YD repeat-containing protein
MLKLLLSSNLSPMKYFLLFFLMLSCCAAAFGQTLSPEEAQKRIAEVTPAPLPQTPAAKNPRSDAELERFKGKVRSVSTWSKDLADGPWRLRSVDEYAENGHLVRSVSYDHLGNPFIVQVYGHLDDKRVSSAGYITYDYDPPAPPAPRDPTPRDWRYTNSYEYKYDSQGRLIERVVRANNGKAYVLKKFVYEGNQVKRVDVERSGTENLEGIDEYNPKGELVRTARPAYRQFAESLYEYRYDKTDEKGNWLERTVTGKAGQWGGKQKDVHRLEKREITYY